MTHRALHQLHATLCTACRLQVVLFRPDRSLDPDTIRRVDGALLAEIKEDSWELFPSNSPFVDDPYVKHVCVPGTKVSPAWPQAPHTAV